MYFITEGGTRRESATSPRKDIRIKLTHYQCTQKNERVKKEKVRVMLTDVKSENTGYWEKL